MKQRNQFFLQFIDKYCKLTFSFKYKIIKNKIIKFRVFRIEDFNLIKFYSVSRFLNRYSDYKFRFSRHLDQKRH